METSRTNKGKEMTDANVNIDERGERSGFKCECCCCLCSYTIDDKVIEVHLLALIEVLIICALILTSLYNLSFNRNSAHELWVGLLTFCLGCIFPTNLQKYAQKKKKRKKKAMDKEESEEGIFGRLSK